MSTGTSADASAAPRLLDRLSQSIERFIHVEAASGVVLLLATAAALLWVNSPWGDSYAAVWHLPVTLGVGPWVQTNALHFWINESLMTVFFLLVGLEIRREIHEGALASWSLALLPLCAAFGGVVVPAAIYLALVPAGELQQGWAIPTATDIAFAVGVLALLGRRVPLQLRILLLSVAVLDDVAAVLIIAVYYSGGIEWSAMVIAASGIALVLLLQRLGFRSAHAYIVPGAILWLGLLLTGIHPTLAGVVLGLMTPVITSGDRQSKLASLGAAWQELQELASHTRNPVELVPHARQLEQAPLAMVPPVVRLQATLHPWVAFGIMPLFALANAGVDLRDPVTTGGSAQLALAVFLALLIGKPLGIGAAVWLGLRTGLCNLPQGVNWRGLLVVGLLGGIGFTMSLFIGSLALQDATTLEAAKLAILMASAVAAISGLVVGVVLLRPRAPDTPPDPVRQTRRPP